MIIPTKDRPEFIKYGLNFLETQQYDNFEVIVCDNYSNLTNSCKIYCEKTKIKNLKYIHPPKLLDMVENWNSPLKHATGDYILYFTDKMMVLPDLLSRLEEVCKSHKLEYC